MKACDDFHFVFSSPHSWLYFFPLTHQSRVALFVVVKLSNALCVEPALCLCDWIRIKSCC